MILKNRFSFLNRKKAEEVQNDFCEIEQEILREEIFSAMKFRIKDGVLEQFIGSDAEIAIPENVRVIGQAAFRKTLVKKLSIGESVFEIQKEAFADCQKIESVKIGGMLFLGEGIFRQCMHLNRAEIGGQIEKIPDAMFEGCSGLKSVEIHRGVRHIGRSFAGCTSLESLELPDTVETIADFAFSGCSNLKNISMNLQKIERIGRRAFYGTALLNRDFLSDLFGSEIFY